jgi:aryl-alcohol dehydrogenase
MHETGDFPLETISKVFRYDQLEDAIKAQHDGSVIKPIIVFD